MDDCLVDGVMKYQKQSGKSCCSCDEHESGKSPPKGRTLSEMPGMAKDDSQNRGHSEADCCCNDAGRKTGPEAEHEEIRIEGSSSQKNRAASEHVKEGDVEIGTASLHVLVVSLAISSAGVVACWNISGAAFATFTGMYATLLIVFLFAAPVATLLLAPLIRELASIRTVTIATLLWMPVLPTKPENWAVTLLALMTGTSFALCAANDALVILRFIGKKQS